MKLKLYSWALSLVLCATSSVFAQNVVPDSVERAVLLAIYDSTDGPNWGQAYRWKLSRINSYPNPDSTLYGITVENGDITSIQLSNVGLDGDIPPSLNQLTELKYLSFYFNRELEGEIPDLSSLQKLLSLDFSYTELSGNIPASLGSLPVLQTLYLVSYPGGPQLSGPVPPELGNLSALRNLSLTNNNLSQAGSIPNELSQLDNLSNLDISSCGISPSCVGSGLSGLNSLLYLNLSSNPFVIQPDSLFPDVLTNLPNLRQLVLEQIPFRYLPGSFPQLAALNYLSLGRNNYSDIDRLSDIIDTLRNCPSLRTLLLQRCQLPALPSDMHTLTTVQDLYLSGNPLQNGAWEDIGQMPVLKNLYVESCNLTELPASLVNQTTLETLYARNNHLYPIPLLIREIPGLKHLYLGNNAIQALPNWIGSGNMNQLLTLNLDNNSIPLPLPDSIRYMTGLTTLSMAYNNLTGVLPDLLADLTSLQTFTLNNNHIQSPLPDLSALTMLRNIHFQNNELTGSVPAFLGNMTVPKTEVNISFNRFDEMTPFQSGTTLTVIVNNNKLNFSNILKVQRPVRTYIYIPQDTVISTGDEIEVEAYIGGTLIITGTADRDTNPPSVYQWFRYVDGVNDIAVSSPSTTGYTYADTNFTNGEVGKYYYKITNPAAPGLSLVSKVIRVKIKPCIADAAVGIAYRKYVCAITFEPGLDSRDCRAITYNWNFGDGKTSNIRRPVHGFENAGTYTVTLTLRYRCGTVCELDTTVQRQITFNPNDAAFKDTVITVLTDKRQEVISTSASSFSDSWPLQHETADLNEVHNYFKGVQGVWRNEGVYVYNVTRSASAETKISTDGTFTVEQFNWQQAELNAIPHWVKSNSITQYSPFSYELENKDVLGIYSAALYDYGGHLPSANGVNMRFAEMAFTGFEFLEDQASGNWVFGQQPRADYQIFEVASGFKNTAIVKARMQQIQDAEFVDIAAKRLFFPGLRQSIYMEDDTLICRQHYPASPEWSVIVVRDAPFPGVWGGQIKVKIPSVPVVTPDIDHTVAHSGKSSLRITDPQVFKQSLLHLDSGKNYLINAWVSVNNPSVSTPKLADSLGMDVILKNSDDEIVSVVAVKPSGPVIEGWQQVKAVFTCTLQNPAVEIRFKPGSTGTAWYDDLRLHPEKGNMKSYVYDLKDYRLHAILDEENFASFFYYDVEGNLHLTKKETVRGIKTITENISYQKETE